MWKVNNNGAIRPLLKVKGVLEPYNAPRQNLPETYWQTGHVDAIRTKTIRKNSMSGETVFPVMVDPRYTVDIDTMNDWRRAEWLATSGEIDPVWPGKSLRQLPQRVKLLVMDFDGVLTDNRVWNDEAGKETIAANRSDGLGIEQLVASGVKAVVISMEENPVVARRCEKMGIPYKKGIEKKGKALLELLRDEKIEADETIFLGNDTNDLPCFPIVACAFAVADAHPEVLSQADRILQHRGGHGAVRELCDLILANNSRGV
jgi:N-acylneuraminate cytidylyltransferase